MLKDSWNRVIQEFSTHKDYLPPPEDWPGTLFSPEQIVICAVLAIGIGLAAMGCARKSEAYQKRVFFGLWLLMAISEPLIILWEAFAGETHGIDWQTALSLWPCSIFLYAAPFAIFGKGNVRRAACGYICTLGLLGGFVNFVYPATYLSRYSILSMAGIRTVFYHGSMVFTAITMLLSGYHGFRKVTTTRALLLPLVPVLLASIPANIANGIIPGADYMFFKMESFFFAPLGQALPDAVTILLVYVIYGIIHVTPYIPSWHANRKRRE